MSKIKKNMGYTIKQNQQEITDFIDELPAKLKSEIAVYIYEGRYSTIKFIQANKDKKFISWVSPLLKAQLFDEKEYIM